MTNAKKLIQKATGWRTANDPDRLFKIAEMIGVLNDELRSLYVRAMRVNPWFFSVATTVVGDGTEWARPAGTTVIHAYGGGDAGDGSEAKLSGGSDPEDDEVHIVPLRDLSAEVSPKIYQLGRAFRSAGGPADPSPSANGDQITFVLSVLHPALDPTLPWDDPANELASHWPEEHNPLLIAHLARYLAVKDGRTEELGALETKIEALDALFAAELEDDTQGLVARWDGRSEG